MRRAPMRGGRQAAYVCGSPSVVRRAEEGVGAGALGFSSSFGRSSCAAAAAAASGAAVDLSSALHKATNSGYLGVGGRL